jgi:hypothetical protein
MAITGRIIALAGIIIIGSGITTAAAVDLEKLVMPGELITGHAKLEGDCESCHVAFSRDQQRGLCLDCHEDIAADVTRRQGYHGRDPAALEAGCSSCHTDHQGRGADIVGLDTSAFDHALTDFALSGAHLETKCGECHAVEVTYREAPGLCHDCHAEDDEHEGGLGRECQTCHQATRWPDTQFDHLEETGFALARGHEPVACVDCHRNDVYADTPTACYDCHRTDDSHKGLNGIDCAACHDTGPWPEFFFDHAVKSDFALTGKHLDTSCADCHTGPVFEVALASDCDSCHRDDDEHHGLNGRDCGSCHSAEAWTVVSFDHARDTDFQLVGAHVEVECAGCHKSPVKEASPPGDCFGCHGDDDPHAGQLGRACAECHGESSWTEAVVFDHGLTRFPLIGAHGPVACADCHETPRFQDASSQCVDCHREDDEHAMALGAACGDCHNSVEWPLWAFDHNRQTSFELDGGHAGIACAACHKRPAERGFKVAKTCGGCHRSDDVHRGEFGTDCERCHSTRDFRAVERVQ